MELLWDYLFLFCCFRAFSLIICYIFYLFIYSHEAFCEDSEKIMVRLKQDRSFNFSEHRPSTLGVQFSTPGNST